MTGLPFYQTCVDWDRDDVSAEGGLSDMIEKAVSVTRRTFLAHVDRQALVQVEKDLGYAPWGSRDLTMAKDWHVSYHRSRLHGQTVYYFCWSAIEHVFALPEIEAAA